MALGNDEQMRVGARVDVRDRDEAVALPDVVALRIELAEEAVRRHRRSPPPRRRRHARARARQPEPSRRRATANSRRRIRARGGRRALRRSRRASSASARGKPRASRRAAARCGASWPTAGTGSSAAVAVPGRGEYGKTCTFVTPAAASTRRVRSNACSSSVGKADDHVGGQVEVRERLEAPEVRRGRVAPTHRAQHAVVARLQRHVQVPGDGRRLPQRSHELVVHVVDLDRGEAETLQARRRSGLAHEPRERVAALTIAEAAEVDAREHDLAMPLLDPLADLPQDCVGAPASRGPADERDHAELAREAAPVLDADERTDPVEPRIGLNASDRADVPATNAAVSSARRETTVTFSGRPANARSRLAAHPVTYTRRWVRAARDAA